MISNYSAVCTIDDCYACDKLNKSTLTSLLSTRTIKLTVITSIMHT